VVRNRKIGKAKERERKRRGRESDIKYSLNNDVSFFDAQMIGSVSFEGLREIVDLNDSAGISRSDGHDDRK
jgi:hypothetical protein